MFALFAGLIRRIVGLTAPRRAYSTTPAPATILGPTGLPVRNEPRQFSLPAREPWHIPSPTAARSPHQPLGPALAQKLHSALRGTADGRGIRMLPGDTTFTGVDDRVLEEEAEVIDAIKSVPTHY